MVVVLLTRYVSLGSILAALSLPATVAALAALTVRLSFDWAQLAPGEISDPVRGGAGYYVVRLVDRSGGELAPFEEVRDQVRAEWLRTQGERALGDYLEELRTQGSVLQKLPPPEPPAAPAPAMPPAAPAPAMPPAAPAPDAARKAS